MLISWWKYFFYKIFRPEKIADIEFCRLGFILDSDYDNKAIYKKTEKDSNITHYIEIRLNLVNTVFITAYDTNYIAYRINMEELDAAMIKVKEIIKRRKAQNAYNATRVR